MMQISEAARAYAGNAASAAAHTRAKAASAADATRMEGPRRELDSQAAGRVFAASVLQRIAVAGTAAVGATRTGLAQPSPSDAPDGVAGALRSRLHAAGPRAEAQVPQLLREVDAGIAAAKNTLARLGYDGTQVASAAVKFRERVGALLASGTAAATQPVEGAAVSAAHVRKERGSIELVTQDGDVVRIRFRSRESERVQVAGVQGPEGSALSARIATEQSVLLKVAVSGDLDAGELAAIEDFLGKVDALAAEFYDGDIEAAFASGAALQADAEEIARYAVKLSVSERFDVRARVQSAPAGVDTTRPPAASAPLQAETPQQPASGVTQPATAPAAAASSENPPAAPVAANEPVAAPANAQHPAAETAAASIAGEPTTGAAAPKATQGLDSLRDFVLRVLDAARAPLHVHGMALEWRVKIELSAALLEAARPDASERPGFALLADVLDRASVRAAALGAAETKTAA